MLRMKVCLCAVRAGKFAICVFLGNLSLSGGRAWSRRSRPAGRAGEDASATLGADDVSRLVALLHQRGLSHHGALCVWRGQAALGHDTAGGHRAQDRRDATAGGWSRRDRLRMSRRDGRLGHHGGGGSIRLLVLLVGIVHHRVCWSTGSLLRWRGRV